MKIRSELFLSLVKQEIGFFDVTKTGTYCSYNCIFTFVFFVLKIVLGDITSRLSADCQTMSDTVALNVNIFLRCFIMFIGSLVVMMKLSWQLTTMVFIAVPLIGIISKVYGKYYEVNLCCIALHDCVL